MSLSSFVQVENEGDTQGSGHGASGGEKGSDPVIYSGTAVDAATDERRSAQGQGRSPLALGEALADFTDGAFNPAVMRKDEQPNDGSVRPSVSFSGQNFSFVAGGEAHGEVHSASATICTLILRATEAITALTPTKSEWETLTPAALADFSKIEEVAVLDMKRVEIAKQQAVSSNPWRLQREP
jgi:hypothetical protein